MAVATTDRVRNDVIAGLHDPVGAMVTAIDRIEAALATRDGKQVAQATRAGVKARDAYLTPILKRAIEGEA